MLTDYLLALFGVFCFLRLLRNDPFNTQKSVRLWAIGFLLSGLAAFVGGTFHGFTPHFSPAMRKALWDITVFLLGSCCSFMVAGTLVASIPRTSQRAKWLITGLAISILGLILLAYRVGLHTDFNHNDLYHCIQIVGLYFFYRGARLLRDGKTKVKPANR
jgi:hypothetical protein